MCAAASVGGLGVVAQEFVRPLPGKGSVDVLPAVDRPVPVRLGSFAGCPISLIPDREEPCASFPCVGASGATFNQKGCAIRVDAPVHRAQDDTGAGCLDLGPASDVADTH